MRVSSYKEHCVEVIKANLNGRKLVVYGDIDREFENRLNEEGIKISFRVLRNKNLCDGVNVVEAGILEGMSSEYYVICFSLTNSDKDTAWIRDYDYQNARDYMFMAAPTVVVPAGAINWSDKNNNRCSYCPQNCRITFVGRNSEVIIATNVKVEENLNIRIGDDCKVIIGEKTIIKKGNWLFAGDMISVEIMDNTTLKSSDLILYSHSNFKIGQNTTIYELLSRAYYNTNLVIGNDCMFSVGIKMYAGDGHAIFDVETGERINLNESDDGLENEKYTISIGDHVWIGADVKILNGSNVGSGSIVGLGTVVKGKFPNNCSIVGNPAKIGRKNVAWSRSIFDMDIISCGEKFCRLTDENYGENE